MNNKTKKEKLHNHEEVEELKAQEELVDEDISEGEPKKEQTNGEAACENGDNAEATVNLKSKLEEERKKNDEFLNILQRTRAEFDNYKKRTAREKDSIYTDAVSDTIGVMLEVLDNLERAVESCKNAQDSEKLLEGIEMVLKQFKDAIGKVGVEQIKTVGEKFDPNLHNAVMHLEDEGYGENEILEEFQKGYKIGDKVIRHSMVKVAN